MFLYLTLPLSRTGGRELWTPYSLMIRADPSGCLQTMTQGVVRLLAREGHLTIILMNQYACSVAWYLSGCPCGKMASLQSQREMTFLKNSAMSVSSQDDWADAVCGMYGEGRFKATYCLPISAVLFSNNLWRIYELCQEKVVVYVMLISHDVYVSSDTVFLLFLLY